MTNPHAVGKSALMFNQFGTEKLPDCSVFRLPEDLAFQMFVQGRQLEPTNPVAMVTTLKDYRQSPVLLSYLPELEGEWLVTRLISKPAEYGGQRGQEMMSSEYTLYHASPISADNQVRDNLVITFHWSGAHCTSNKADLVVVPHRHVVRHTKVWYE